MDFLRKLYRRIKVAFNEGYSLTKALIDILGPALGTVIVARLAYLRFNTQKLAFSEFQKFLEQGMVKKVECASDSIAFNLKTEGSKMYETIIPGFLQKEDVWTMLNDNRMSTGLEISVSRFERYSKRILNGVMLVGPLVYFVYVVYFMNRLVNGAPNKSEKSNVELADDDDKKDTVTFKDVAGLGPAKEELQNLVHMIRNRDRYISLGAFQPKGVLLYGPPGVGKT